MIDNSQRMHQEFERMRKEYETAERVRLDKENEELRARVKELEAALKPFAERHDDIRQMLGKVSSYYPVDFEFRDLSRASAALNGEKQ
jgi:hypothetical protein